MSNQENIPVQFRGNALLFVKQMCLHLAIIAPLLSFFMMGLNWYYFLLLTMALMFPFLLLMALALHAFDRFSLDDSRQKIVKAFLVSIPYQKVREIQIHESNTLLTVSAVKGRMQKVCIALALDKKEKERLLAELSSRFPDKIRQKKIFEWKAIAVFSVLFLIAYGAFIGYLYRKYPQIQAMCLTSEIPDEPTTGGVRYRFPGISFCLPENFDFIETTENGDVFSAENGKTEFIVSCDSYQRIGKEAACLLHYGTGVRDIYDLYHTICSERFGVIPLLLKAIFLSNWHEVEIFKVECAEIKGIVVQGKVDNREKTDVVVVDKSKGKELYFVFSGEKISKDVIEKLVQHIETGK